MFPLMVENSTTALRYDGRRPPRRPARPDNGPFPSMITDTLKNWKDYRSGQVFEAADFGRWDPQSAPPTTARDGVNLPKSRTGSNPQAGRDRDRAVA